MDAALLENTEEDSTDTAELGSQPENSTIQTNEPAPVEAPSTNNARTRRSICSSPATLICISHAFSAWGDRMWAFAISIFLLILTPDSFRLVAIYGMAVSLSVVAFGPLVGDWIDATPRLRAARLTLILQNIAVAVCAGVLLIMMLITVDTGTFYFLAFLLIVLAIIAQLASVGTTIAIERDWVVVITSENSAALAGTNANLRRIDLTCNILAPVITGFILFAGSTVIGILFVAGWNILSLFLEYFLLSAVYNACPALAHKSSVRGRYGNKNDEAEFSSLDLDDNLDGDGEVLVPRVKSARSFQSTWAYLSGKVKARFRTLRFGFKLYFQQRVALAGLGLAALYLTVLGFDSITTAYAYSQHLSPAILGVLTAAGALTGILGTFIFPQCRKRFGLVKTGLISMSVQLFFLMFCVASVWAPGHPGSLLDPLAYPDHRDTAPLSVTTAAIHNTMKMSSTVVVQPTPTRYSRAASTIISYYQNSTISPLAKSSAARGVRPTSVLLSRITISSCVNGTVNNNTCVRNNTSDTSPTRDHSGPYSFISLGLLMGGIVMSRVGLWMTDLVITQLFQENIAETERGIVGGVQNSFNNMMDVAHFVLVTVAPEPEQFGALVLVSVFMVGLGFACYARFAWKFRRRLAQLEKLSQWSNSKESLEGSSSRLRRNDQGNSQDDIMTGVLTVENENYSL